MSWLGRLGFEARCREVAERQIKAEEENEKRIAKKREADNLFIEKYKEQIDAILEDYPEVTYWEIAGPKSIVVTKKTKEGKKLERCKASLDDDGSLLGISGRNVFYEPIKKDKDYVDKVRVAKISAMLKDNDNVRMYCDIIADQLRDDDRQAFDATTGLECTVERFNAEYYDEAWINAWKKALLAEFQAKSVEYKGDGLFMLTAI